MGTERDILQRRVLKDSVAFLLSQGMIQSRWDAEGVEIRGSYQFFSTRDLQSVRSHHVAAGSLGSKVTAPSFIDALVLIFPAYTRLLPSHPHLQINII